MRRAGQCSPWYLWCLAALAVSATCEGEVSAGPAATLVGRPVVEVLEAFRQQGHPVMYSDQLVTPDLRVLQEPARRDVPGKLAEILQPHGLDIQAAEGFLLVVRGARGPPAQPAGGAMLVIVGDATQPSFDLPEIRLSRPGHNDAWSARGAYHLFTGLAPGPYRVEVSAPGREVARQSVQVAAARTTSVRLALEPAAAELDALTVFASRYLLLSTSRFLIDQRAIQQMPGHFEDPVRSAQRLPGTAAGGFSARSRFRGGDENETAIHLNGLRLVDPFHVRDFHNLFSAIDARAISGVEAYTGGFPADFGNRTSGLMLLRTRRPEAPRRTELGVSVFNTSLLHTGYSADQGADWLISARRSNLEWVLDATEHGQPSYHDLLATAGFELSDRTALTFNALSAEDRVLVITEHLPEEREQAETRTDNEQFWLLAETRWSPRLTSATVAAMSRYANDRDALANDPEQFVAQVRDRRDLDGWSLRQDWQFEAGASHALRWGWEIDRRRVRFDYRADADYVGFYLAYPGVTDRLERRVQRTVRGRSAGAFIADRFVPWAGGTVEWGVRWDRQDWPHKGTSQVSPRFNLLQQFGDDLSLRLAWGRYHQAQELQHLQVEDGESDYHEPQRAEQLILGARWRLAQGYALRIEAFRKHYGAVQPRYENLLDPLPLIAELEPDRIRLAPDSARVAGFEATLEYDGREDLDWWFSYSLSRATDRLDGRSQPRAWDQRHLLQAGLLKQFGAWTIGAALKARTGWPTTLATLRIDGDGEDSELALIYGPRNAARLDAFVSFDVRIAREWSLGSGRLSVFFELSNALDRRNECCVDYDVEDEDAPVLERSVDHWLGGTPAAGLLWEF